MNGGASVMIRVGMRGTFSGKEYRVAGRVLMGEKEGSETYFWNEFNLVGDSGEVATLVFEETEEGGKWRMFTLFEPQNPMSAASAAEKRVGNEVDLDGTSARVTLVGQSRVYQIEGEAPEGVEMGDRADYFNAEAGHKMIVVSWTGDEVECYHGITITSAMVATAFNIDVASLARMSLASRANFADEDDDEDESSPATSMSPGSVKMIIAFVAIGIAIFAAKVKFASSGDSSGVKRYGAPPVTLVLGSSGQLHGKNYRIVGRTEVEIAEVNWIASRNEFILRDDEGGDALLVNGLKPGGKDWCLFQRLYPAEPLTPQQAGNLRLGRTLNVGGVVTPVNELFRSTQLNEERKDSYEFVPSRVFYGFEGESGTNVILARWNEYGIAFHQGQRVEWKDVNAAFAGKQ